MGWFDHVRFELLTDLGFIQFFGIWYGSVRHRFEQPCSGNEIDLMRCNVDLSKLENLHGFVFLQHLPDGRMILSIIRSSGEKEEEHIKDEKVPLSLDAKFWRPPIVEQFQLSLVFFLLCENIFSVLV